MTLVLELPEETGQRLREAARRAGREVEQFIVEAATEKAGHAANELTIAEAGALLEVSPVHVQRLLESGRLQSLSPIDVTALRNRYEAANRAMDEIVAITEAAGLYEHQQ